MLLVDIKLLVLFNMSYTDELIIFLNKAFKKKMSHNFIKYKYNNSKIFIYNCKNSIRVKKILNKFLYSKALGFFIAVIYKTKKINLRFRKINNYI
uniref:Uncharacterized protein n=1 Tax=Lotharella vacuolata TaxID=74820 RepID=A0A0H5BL48_9EUKA|nr:hypothetical protein [Lotharella vacuolata]